MPKTNYQARTGGPTRSMPISVNQMTVDGLDEIKFATKESRSAIIQRLVERERGRVRAEGVPKALVLTFPSYEADGDRIETRIIYRTGTEERLFEGLGERLKPTPPLGSYVLLTHDGERFRGQLERAELDKEAEQPLMILTVRALNPQPHEIDDILQRVENKLAGDKIHGELEDPRTEVLNRAIELGARRLTAYLTEFMGEVRDPRNSPLQRYAGERGTVDAENGALYALGLGSVEKAVRKLEALGIGRRISNARDFFYIQLDADDFDQLFVAEARKC